MTDFLLHRAVLNRDVSRLTKLLHKKRCDPNEFDPSGYTPLQLAIHTGFFDGIEPLITAGAKFIGFGAKSGWKGLAEARLTGSVKMLKLLSQRFEAEFANDLARRTPEVSSGLSALPDFRLGSDRGL